MMPSARLTVLACVAFATACTSGSGDAIFPAPGSSTEFENAGGGGGDALQCPTGSSDLSIGNVIRDFSFDGYVDPEHRGFGPDKVTQVSLCDFYNPTGEEVYGTGTPFDEGSPKPRALMINVAALWCQPCKLEAGEILPEEYALYHPRGLELISILADTNSPGESAQLNHLDGWVGSFQVEYVAVIDPDRRLTNQLNAAQFPSNVLVDTSTMRIVESLSGLPDDGFFAKAEQLLGP